MGAAVYRYRVDKEDGRQVFCMSYVEAYNLAGGDASKIQEVEGHG